MKVPEEKIREWLDGKGTFEHFTVRRIAARAAEWSFAQTKERAKAVCSALRAGGSTEWQESHLQAVAAINDCIAAIDALTEDGK